MNIHKNARLTPLRREEMARLVLDAQLPQAQASKAYGVTAKILARWLTRLREHGTAGMADRSSRPHRLQKPTTQSVVDRIIDLRRQRLAGNRVLMAQMRGRSTLNTLVISQTCSCSRLSRLKEDSCKASD